MPDIPYPALRRIFWRVPAEQGYIPFLGAGVSVSARTPDPEPPTGPYPEMRTLDEFLTALKLEGSARVFGELALLLAFRLQNAEKCFPKWSAQKLLEYLIQQQYPPYAGELASLCALQADFDAFEDVAKRLDNLIPADRLTSKPGQRVDALRLLAALSRIANPPDALSSIAGYYEDSVNRSDLWGMLYSVIAPKKEPTETHKYLAEVARHHVDKAQSDENYLIVTTNYDPLMELALDHAEAPYVVLTNRLDAKDPQKPFFRTMVEFSKLVPDEDRRPPEQSVAASNFTLQTRRRLVIVYKIHGSLTPASKRNDEEGDEIIISENDYINFMSTEDPIPSQVLEPLKKKPVLFLGYSLNDWNVRSIFTSIRRKRAFPRGDMCVNKTVRTYERLFFRKNEVNVYEADLNEFVARLRDEQS